MPHVRQLLPREDDDPAAVDAKMDVLILLMSAQTSSKRAGLITQQQQERVRRMVVRELVDGGLRHPRTNRCLIAIRSLARLLCACPMQMRASSGAGSTSSVLSALLDLVAEDEDQAVIAEVVAALCTIATKCPRDVLLESDIEWMPSITRVMMAMDLIRTVVARMGLVWLMRSFRAQMAPYMNDCVRLLVKGFKNEVSTDYHV